MWKWIPSKGTKQLSPWVIQPGLLGGASTFFTPPSQHMHLMPPKVLKEKHLKDRVEVLLLLFFSFFCRWLSDLCPGFKSKAYSRGGRRWVSLFAKLSDLRGQFKTEWEGHGCSSEATLWTLFFFPATPGTLQHPQATRNPTGRRGKNAPSFRPKSCIILDNCTTEHNF